MCHRSQEGLWFNNFSEINTGKPGYVSFIRDPKTDTSGGGGLNESVPHPCEMMICLHSGAYVSRGGCGELPPYTL